MGGRGCFPGAGGQAWLKKQAARPLPKKPWGDIVCTRHATFQRLPGREEAISATHWSFAPLMPETLLFPESSWGTVMSQMLGSGENHAPRSLLKKSKVVPGR